MPTFINRKELAYLVEWASRSSHKPLVIRGARQVGKSTLVRQFAQSNNFSILEINFERNPEFKDAFVSNDPAQIQLALTLLTGQEIVPGQTLLFLDEIQVAPEAITALRYFYEEMPKLHVVAAGSLLEFTIADAQFSMPVGRVEYLHLGPIQFDDFVNALGQSELTHYLDNMSLGDIGNHTLIPAVHDKCMGLLKQYFIVGGLPEAVAIFAKSGSYSDVNRIHQSILSTYRDDFHKYSHGKLTQLIQLVFDRLPVMVGRKFKYAQISRDYKAAQLDSALQHLCMARVATKIFRTSANGVPLGAEVDHKSFKILCLDIGLMCSALDLNVHGLSRIDPTLINSGALAEQFAGQQLMHRSNYYDAPALFYWAREKKSAAAEIDYLLTVGQQIVPVEIKAGKTGTLKSLHQFLQDKNRNFGLRFNADLPSILKDTKKLSNGTMINYQLLSLPLYMINQARRLADDCLS